MKKVLITFIAMTLPMLASAEKVEIDGIWYNLISKSQIAEVTYGNWDEMSYRYNGDDERYSGDIVIPSSIEYEGYTWNVKVIGLNAFRGCKYLNSISLPKSLISIGICAFYQCHNLRSITIPESVTLIDDGAFCDCKNLTKVYISDIKAWLNISFGDSFFTEPHQANPLSIAKHLYLNGIEIKDLVIPEGITSIGNFAFDGCEGLTSVKIPNSVNSIGYAAFYNCTGLTQINIPNSVTSINHYAFYGCTNLTSVSIPNSVTNLGQYVFAHCINLSFLELSHNINTINKYSFYDCSNLTSVTIPNNVNVINGSAFQDCTKLKILKIGSGINSITRYSYESGAFEHCQELSDVYCMAENVPYTDNDAFKESLIEYSKLHVPVSAINAYKTTAPWSGFGEIVSISDDQMQKCATPTISLVDGEIVFSCDTEGVEYVSEVTSSDIQKFYDDKLKLTYIYKVTVYATKTGYENSDTATMEITASGKLGDLNADGKVDATDHVKLSDIIMNQK